MCVCKVALSNKKKYIFYTTQEVDEIKEEVQGKNNILKGFDLLMWSYEAWMIWRNKKEAIDWISDQWWLSDHRSYYANTGHHIIH